LSHALVINKPLLSSPSSKGIQTISLAGKGIQVIDLLKSNPYFNKNSALQTTVLNLQGNKIKSLHGLNQFKNLKILNLKNNPV
jgi:Leucine-rich repeat (LRR) protein